MSDPREHSTAPSRDVTADTREPSPSQSAHGGPHPSVGGTVNLPLDRFAGERSKPNNRISRVYSF